MKKKRIGIVGPLNIDFIMKGEAPTEMEKLLLYGGTSDIFILVAGTAGYLSQNINKLGVEVHLVSAISDDGIGLIIKDSLEKQEISTGHLNIEKDTLSGIATYLLLFGSNKRPIICRMPTHEGFPSRFKDEQSDYLLDSDIIHCGGILHFPYLWDSGIVELFSKAKKMGRTTSLDAQFPLAPLNPPWEDVLGDIIPNVDIWFMDEAEAIGMTGSDDREHAIKKLRSHPVPLKVLKLGEEGAIIINGDKIIKQPIFTPDKFVDNIGAGDSFDAAFLYGRLKGFDISRSAEIAAFAAAKSCESVGGTESFPDEKCVLSFEG